MWLNLLFVIAVNFINLCPASYHEQYRVPKISTEKWESYILGEKEYIIQKLPVKWESAGILCRGYHNGTLAVIDSLEKAEFLAEALSESNLDIESAWVGAHRPSDSSAGYRWISGAPLRRTASDVLPVDGEIGRHEYPTWVNRTSVPVPDGGADCVAIDRVGHDKPVFLDLQCSIERPFVCEKEAQQVSVVSEISLVRCKTGLYRVYSGKLTWDQAAAYCVMRKMSLANIETMRCLRKLGMSMLKTRPSIENAWVGARGELGQWTWIDTGASIFVPSLFTDATADQWPPMRDRTTIKQSGCLQLDRHSAPVLLEARCERRMQFICYEASKIAMQAQLASTAPPSDDTYYYILVRKALFWQHARDNCLKMNGTLAKIDSNEVLTELLMLMGENKEAPVDHVWISGRLNMTKDITTDTVSYYWYNPVNDRRIPDPKSFSDGYIPPWLDEDFSMDNSCLNLDRQNHLSGLIYGMPCDTAQYSICMIEKSLLIPEMFPDKLNEDAASL